MPMHNKLKMGYKDKPTRGMQKWIEICSSRWLLMKSLTNSWRRFRRKNLAIMILSLEKIVNYIIIILCFR
jgi:hypothetical protein